MSKENQQSKKKKEKIVYIDDGSTVADMSGVGRRPRPTPQVNRGVPPSPGRGRKGRRAHATRAGSIWQTYTDTVRAMIGPMLITLGGISAVFLLAWIILGFFA